MSEQEQNIELVKKGYQAFSTGDLDTVITLYDDTIEWIQPGESAISGTYHGKGELREYLGRLAEKPPTVKPLRFLADGDTVVVLSETTIDDESAPDAEVYTLRDGNAVRVQVYGDTAMMERVYGKKQVAADS
jgi:uncharacterized protein